MKGSRVVRGVLEARPPGHARVVFAADLPTGMLAAMSRFFNTAGPVFPEDHYCLPPLTRVDMGHIRTLIDQKKYFVLHAPRQTGKTSCLLAMRDALNREGKYFCVYANVELAQGARENVEKGLSLILQQIADRAAKQGDESALALLAGMDTTSVLAASPRA